MDKAWKKFRPRMEGTPFLVSALINDQTFAKALIDTGCMSYGLCNSKFATKNNLQRLQISPREIQRFDGSAGQINEVVCVSMDIEGHYEDRVFLYVMSNLVDYDLILVMPCVTTNHHWPLGEALVRGHMMDPTDLRDLSEIHEIHEILPQNGSQGSQGSQ